MDPIGMMEVQQMIAADIAIRAALELLWIAMFVLP